MRLQLGVAGELRPRVTWLRWADEKKRVAEGKRERFIVSMTWLLEKAARKEDRVSARPDRVQELGSRRGSPTRNGSLRSDVED